MLEFIDTHAHFYDEAYKEEELDLLIDRAKAAGVRKVIQADTGSGERDRMFAVSERYPGTLFSMLGLYPGLVDSRWEREVELLHGYTDRKIVAIGEIGLDYHYSAATAEWQKKALAAQFELAAALDLPVNIHMRDATEDFVRIVAQYRHLGLRGNLHAYSGSYETFLTLQKYGDWSVGIGGVVTFRNSRLPATVRRLPLDRLLLETDAPYLSPVPLRGTRNESANIPLIAAAVAQIKELSVEEVAAATTANAEALFHLSEKTAA